MADFDLAIIGGGVNGVGIARDAAGRGLGVLLLEQNDLGSGTSSASTKLIHGGLRYLEQYDFRLVRKSLIERDILLRAAPHVIRPMRFVLPHHDAMRPAWMLRIGLFIYDRLGGRSILPRTRVLDLSRDPVGVPLKQQLRLAFEYSDCWVDDARLVVLNAIDAAERGAVIRPRTRLVSAERKGRQWRLALDASGRDETVTARALVNAAGPWVGLVAEAALRQRPPQGIRLVKGSHIVVPRMFAHDRAYVFQHVDGRIIFAIPYEHAFTLIGTTDEDFAGDLSSVNATPQEVEYLCRAVNRYFREPVSAADVVWTYAGVRPLYDDGEKRAADLRRDYVLALDAPSAHAPLLTVYGGKITTYRRLAETALRELALFPAAAKAWTAAVPLPGGDFPVDGVEPLIASARAKWPFLAESHVRRLVQAYGTRMARVLGAAGAIEDLGRRFGDLTEAEVRYLMQEEWAETADDILWRRTKLGLHLSSAEKAALACFMDEARREKQGAA